MRDSITEHFLIPLTAVMVMLAGASAFCGNWVGPEIIDFGAPNILSGNPRIAFDRSGSAISLFTAHVPRSYYAYRLYSSYWDGVKWGLPKIIDAMTQYFEGGSEEQVTLDGNGSGIAVFSQYDGANHRIYSNRWNGSQWEGAAIIDAATGYDAGSPQIAMDSAGRALAVFRQNQDKEKQRVYANRWNGSGWEGAKLIDADTGYSANDPQIAFDGNGNAIAIFRQYSKSGEWLPYDGIYANRWNGSEWEGAKIVDTEPGFGAQSPQVAMDESGNAIVVYVKRTGYLGPDPEREHRLFAFHWNGSGWSSSAMIDAGDFGYWPEACHPQIAFNSSGNAIAVFAYYDYDHSGHGCLFANHWNGAQWEGATMIDRAIGQNMYDQELAYDECGDAIVVFKNIFECAPFILGCTEVYSALWNGSMWESPIRIGMGHTSEFPQIASVGKGNYIAVFQHSEIPIGDYHVCANRYVAKNYVELKVRPSDSGGYEFSPGDQVWLDWEVNPGPYELTSIPCEVYLTAVLNPVVEDSPAYIYQIKQSPAIYLFDSRFKPSRLKARSADATYPRVTFRRPDAHPSGSLSFTIPKNIAASRWAFAVVFVRLDGKGFPAMLPVEVSNSFTVH